MPAFADLRPASQDAGMLTWGTRAPMTLEIDGTLLLAGAGNMGSAMLAGWLQEGLAPAQIIVQDPAPPPRATELLARRGLTAQAAISSLPDPPAVIVVAVKPQVIDEVFPGLA